ncbi:MULTISPECIES: murein biosynthesis integral membrane protein MurJ [unclassified Bosea (in: a-proteobacteria)]|uniref:murein biosynthesis integral membrane protein MurJ n=1 Tax=unclassified Bosea (in: a-proteobacteria) TaxID=2653178 RepID=UPI000F75F4CD|nr:MULTISPECIES: murein biosynthesis integral membrane protein MurJ [unclassified Bosea (in: a-proteobacteria)]AZO79815.1 murein biosynthesis integral membrane protein MurJ [Bosea sp. Tri-49]RXT15930.1 murein biosynthesis integral membrane protein MurJ [Bosea sp. Tri-39]RXT39621.1 murein biosynthesis integral membrane protein MurJ [Bosea sp. Tri-54]
MSHPGEAEIPPSRLARDSFIVGAATILSRLLGFARDVLIARLLGAGPVADAFLAALRLPNLVRRVLGEGGLNAPFVPLYLAIRAERGEEAAKRFAGAAASQLGLLLIGFVALAEIFAPWVVLGLAGGFADEPQTLALAAFYMRLMLPFVLLTTLAALLAALLNAEGRFTVAALAPALMNAILLAALLVELFRGSDSHASATLLAACLSLAGLAHLVMILLRLRGIGLPRLSLRWSPDMTRLVRTGGATLLAASAAQLVLLVSTQIASTEPGSVSALYYADRVFQLPLSFFGVAMGTVVLSAMAGEVSQADHDALLGRALALGLALATPAAAALIVLAEPIVSVLFENGQFGVADRERTAAALAAFACGLPFALAAKVFGQVYFVRRLPRLPLIAGFVAVAVTALAGYALLGWRDAAMIGALAASLAFIVQAGLLATDLLRTGLWRPRWADVKPVLAILSAAALMVLALNALIGLFLSALDPGEPVLRRACALTLLCCAGAAIYALAGFLLGAFDALLPPRLLRLRGASVRTPRS